MLGKTILEYGRANLLRVCVLMVLRLFLINGQQYQAISYLNSWKNL